MKLTRIAYKVDSIELRVELSFPTLTPNRDTSTYRIALGNHNVSALKDEEDSLYYFNSDEMLSTVTTFKDSVKYFFVYKPAVENMLIGKEINFLEKIKTFHFKYSGYINSWIKRGKITDSTVCMVKFLVKINGVDIGKKIFKGFVIDMKRGECYINVTSVFKRVIDKYKKYLK